MATRLSKRTEVKFTPFCRPTADSILKIAQLYYSVPEEQRIDAMYDILQAVWTKGKDFSHKAHLQQMQRELGVEQLTELDINSLLQENDARSVAKHQPDFPILELRIDGKQYTFNSLYRVWMIESIFSNVLEQKYKAENQSEHRQ